MSRRSGFTLIELLVTVVILSLLMALLLPAVNSVRQRVNLAAARSELSQLESAITAFRAKYGVDPPSGVTLYEQAPWDAQSQATIRRIFPQFDFTKTRDFNKNGVLTDKYVFDGPKCLLLFIGGTNDGKRMLGLAANPLDPFDSSSTNRIGPFFEFDESRLMFDKDSLATYRDRLGDKTSDPIVYYSAYEGSGYVTADEYNGFKAYQNKKPQTYQLVSPGFDGKLGKGGAPPYVGDDQDNLTNFQTSTMVPR